MKRFVKSTSKYPGYTHVSWNVYVPLLKLGIHRYAHLSFHRLSNGVDGIRLQAALHRYAEPIPEILSAPHIKRDLEYLVGAMKRRRETNG